MTDECRPRAHAAIVAARGFGRPASPALGEDEVHVWRVWLDAAGSALGQLADILSSDELRRASSFVFTRDHERFVARRAFLRLLLAAYLDRPPGALEFGYADNGKPELAVPSGSAVTFNCAHSHGLAVYAVARGRRVGVDVEAVRRLPEAEEMAQLCFSARERSELATLPPGCLDEAFLRGWTRKEAYAKAVGDGLTRSLKGVEVSLAPRALSALHRIDGDPEMAARWASRAWSPGRGYVAALVVEGPRCEPQWMPDMSPAAACSHDA